MPAIAFLVVSFLCGFEITKRMKVNIWGRIAAGIGIGYLISGWIVYIVSYFSKVVLGLTHPKVYGNIASIAVMLLIAFLLIAKDKTKTSLNTTKKESAFFMDDVLCVPCNNRKRKRADKIRCHYFQRFCTSYSNDSVVFAA